jgi:hypothetical protein
MVNLITTLPRSGDPGSIVNTRPPNIITCRYVSNLVAQQYTLNLNPIAGAIANLANYSMVIRGSQSTLIYQAGLGTPLLDLTSQLVSHINRFGYLWASISGSGIITLSSREPGIDNGLILQGGLFGATLTQTVAPSFPLPLTAGTMVAWDVTYDPNDPWASNRVTSLDRALLVGGFTGQRDLAGVVVRSTANYSTSDQISGTEVEVLRNGNIWVRNYGTTTINRSTVTAFNTLESTPTLPSGAFGIGSGLVVNSPLTIQYQSIARPQETAILGINLA